MYVNVKKNIKQFRRHWQLILLLLPSMVYLIIFHYWPMYGVQIAFRDFNPVLGFVESKWLGLRHFDRFLNYPDFIRLIRNTLSITVYRLLAGFPIPILIAIMINETRSHAFKRTVQMVTYIPHFISTVVLCGMVALFLDREAGLFNLIGSFFGKEPVAFLTVPRYFQHIHVWSGIWQNTGWGTIIYLAALSQVDTQVVEAALVDGATRMQRIAHVDLPHLTPTIVIQFLLSIGSLLNIGFEKVLLLQNDLNMETSDVISTYVYRNGLLGGQFSYTSAIDLFNTTINLLLLILFNRISSRATETSMY